MGVPTRIGVLELAFFFPLKAVAFYYEKSVKHMNAIYTFECLA